nr:coiled-coil domain-containing protein 66-like [Lytechinus pictus]
MNRGEGLRIAAKAKSGNSIGHMFKDTKIKPKKFGYKSKTQSFPVRKNVHGISDEGNQQLSKTVGRKPAEQQKSTNKQNGSLKREVLNQRNASHTTKAQDQKEKAKSNFIDKNKKALSKKEKILKQADTVTLTQDQLNAILKTIGTAGESAGAPRFSIDAGELKVNLRSINEQTAVTENEKENVASADIEEPVISINQYSNNNNDQVTQEVASHEERTKESPRTTDPVQKQSPRMGQSDIINTIGMTEQNDKSLMEKKKQQWKRELDAQLAAKKAAQEKDGRGRRGRSQNEENSGWNPWGQPGGGAPLRSSVDVLSPRYNPAVSTGHPSPGRSSRGQGSNDMLSQSISGVTHIESQRNVPAAMRSSFVIGGIANERNDELKRKEKQQWLQDLENQKREAREKKEQEKASKRALESAVAQHWAEPVEHPPSRMISRMDNKVNQVQDDSRVMSRMAAERKEQAKETDQPKSAPLNSSRSPHTIDEVSPRSHLRPSNALTDPAEMERREAQKKKHMEHMAFVQAQVEEKRRKKQEALALRRQEEAEQERKLAEERDRLARDFEHEQEKVRKKEEAAAAKQRALEESMQNAHEAAMREKHAERMRKLQRQGHDVTNLRKSWEEKQHSPEVSPRLPVQVTVSHPQPDLKPATSINFSPRRERGPSADLQGIPQTAASHIQDAATSPINEVSTQTDVLDENYISPRLIEAIRRASEGAEYKPKSKKRSDQEKSKHPAEEGRRKDKGVKVVSIKEEVSEQKANKGRKNTDAAKPKWGQNAQSKKGMKNSDKDMSMSKRKREERLRKRQDELISLQEKSAPRRLSQTKQTHVENEGQGRKSRADTKLSHHSDEKESKATKVQRERAGSRREEAMLAQERVMSQQQSRKDFRPSSSDDSYSTQTPTLGNNDFVPFMRTEDDELLEGNISISPAPAPPRPAPKTNDASPSRTSRHSRQSHREMDPLLNPDRLKDKEHRQEEILMQLSTLRKGLLMKQRELEIGLSPSSPVII